jgi:hypothetical protein
MDKDIILHGDVYATIGNKMKLIALDLKQLL